MEWLYWSYASAPLRAVVTVRAANPRQALRLAGQRLALLWGGSLLFAGGTSMAIASLPWPDSAGAAASAATLVTTAARLAAALGETLASPHHPALRLLPTESGRPGSIVAPAAVLGGLAAAATLLPSLAGAEAPHLETAARVVVAASLAVAIVMTTTRSGRKLTDGNRRGARFPSRAGAAGLVCVAFVAWFVGEGGLAVALADVGCAAALLVASRRVVQFLWQDELDCWEGTVPNLALSAARFGIVSTAIAIGALIATDAWGWSVGGDAGPLALRAFGTALLAFAAHAAWLALRASVDGRLRRLAVDDPHDAAGPNGRLLTLLPLLRTTAAVTLATSFALSALWMLDIPIAPLLAGAGVFGLAIGFGAQALVRDVISGVFYLVEDVFRVGEYIESGSSTKGTVERITLRTVALRHQNGPLHFVPYGSLGTVRNTSRDWVIDKFDLPLPVGTDSEGVRKLVKRIGVAMKEDPTIGPLLQEPLKAKLYRIEPGVKTFRCKFQTLPGRQFEIRADAYRRIEAALSEAGIAFAEPGSVVIMNGGQGVCGAHHPGGSSP
ncbi:mechanosensitive ion channel family protein [Lichenibacterium minor]|uniref:Mechanosensitive ion channel family protein n=1 Tax=Lichenibacterium minor TaxID=2316528 RepID=A0A4Q2U2C0_9HYPH|nr:mechanosensitive ion channel family protein [Lichenibacterium minor]RYC28816.1 mechanosensitive ion channel family protein [Lichenibacterium minor]